MTSQTYQEYTAWDAPTRWFHWINVLAVIGLIASGLVVLNDDALGLSTTGKLLLKSIHVSLGYSWRQTSFGGSFGLFSATDMRDGEAYCRAVRAI